jgi:hypothetical protein
VRLAAPALGRRAAASGRYRCAAGRTAARLAFSPAAVKRLPRGRAVAAVAAVRQRGRTARSSVLLQAGRATAAPGYWTDGNLHCAADAPAGAAQAYLATPDFTTSSLTPVSTRAWIAWHTASSGWQWLGSEGAGRSAWQTWTATPTGIAQFHPGGAVIPVPWTWGPVSVPAGQGIAAVGVYEIVYWAGGRPTHRWRYVNAGPAGAAAAGGGTHYCSYP